MAVHDRPSPDRVAAPELIDAPTPRPSIRDLTDLAQPALAACPQIDQVIGGYHHQDRFFFADEQVADIAFAMTTRNLVRGGTGWRLRGDRPSRLLLRAWINGQIHYEFPDDWQWRPFALPRQPSTAGRR